MLGAADGVQVLLFCSHGGRLQRLRVALQRVQLLPLAVHVVLVALQVRRLKAQVVSERTSAGAGSVTPPNKVTRYLGEGLGARSTDKRLLSSVPPLVVLQVRLVFKRLQTGETQSGGQAAHGQAGHRRGGRAHLVAHLAGERSFVAVDPLVFLQVGSANEGLPTDVAPVGFEARVDLQVL